MEPCIYSFLEAQAGKLARGIDASPVLVASIEGLDCLSAIEECQWTQEVITPSLYEQCLFLPGEVAQIMLHHLYQAYL